MNEFLTPLQITSFFSRLAAKIRQQPAAVAQEVEEEDTTAANEEENFASAREFVLAEPAVSCAVGSSYCLRPTKLVRDGQSRLSFEAETGTAAILLQ